MKKTIILFVLLTLVLALNVSADVIIPRTKSIDWCYEISNINDHPNYRFLLLDKSGLSSYSVIKQGDCISFYKLGVPSIYALTQENFNELSDELTALTGTSLWSSPTWAQEDTLNYRENYLKVENYLGNYTKFIPSNIKLDSYGVVSKNDPLEKVRIVLEISLLNRNNFEIKKSKVIYTYNDGTSEEKIFQDQNITPEPSRKAVLPGGFARFWYIILPILAIIVILIILLKRKRK